MIRYQSERGQLRLKWALAREQCQCPEGCEQRFHRKKDSFLAYSVSGMRNLVTFRKIIPGTVCTQRKENASSAFRWQVLISQGHRCACKAQTVLTDGWPHTWPEHTVLHTHSLGTLSMFAWFPEKSCLWLHSSHSRQEIPEVKLSCLTS